MLRIGKLTDYALLIMSQIAKKPGCILSATALADSLHLKTPTVSKILKILTDANLLQSVRGSVGGYQLNRSADCITVADIITAMEGELALTECCANINFCVIDSSCVLRENWIKINSLVKNFLTRVTLLDMLSPLALQGLTHD